MWAGYGVTTAQLRGGDKRVKGAARGPTTGRAMQVRSQSARERAATSRDKDTHMGGEGPN